MFMKQIGRLNEVHKNTEFYFVLVDFNGGAQNPVAIIGIDKNGGHGGHGAQGGQGGHGGQGIVWDQGIGGGADAWGQGNGGGAGNWDQGLGHGGIDVGFGGGHGIDIHGGGNNGHTGGKGQLVNLNPSKYNYMYVYQ